MSKPAACKILYHKLLLTLANVEADLHASFYSGTTVASHAQNFKICLMCSSNKVQKNLIFFLQRV